MVRGRVMACRPLMSPPSLRRRSVGIDVAVGFEVVAARRLDAVARPEIDSQRTSQVGAKRQARARPRELEGGDCVTAPRDDRRAAEVGARSPHLQTFPAVATIGGMTKKTDSKLRTLIAGHACSGMSMREFAVWRFEGIRHRHLPESPIGDSMVDALRQWDTLIRYLDDGLLDIHNSRVEREMRGVAVWHKSRMFAGSAASARPVATSYSLVNTCGLLVIEPWTYRRDVLQRIAEGADAAPLT